MSETRIVDKSERSLSRGIRSWHVSLIAIGGIIGSGYFLGLGETFGNMGAAGALISYALAGITIYGVMQSFAELLVNIPRRGSFVSYTRQFMGDTASAGIGWSFWANWVCYIPAEALAFATFVNVLCFGGKDPTPFHIRTFIIGVIALALLTLINVYQVKWFGHIESIMAILKILAIAIFVILGILIWLGIANNGADIEGTHIKQGFIGLSAMFSEGGAGALKQLFPGGGMVIITMMILTLVNFQGSEIVGLSAAETQDPEKNVPSACRKVAVRIILLYLVPIFVLSLIMPYFAAGLSDSVFASALMEYGFGWGARVFQFVCLIAAFSCANAGFYGTVRALYGLSVEGLAPKFLSDLNKFNTPHKATLFSLAFVWFIFVISFLMKELGLFGGEDNALFIALISIAGFTGTLCWVGILYSQIAFRKRLKERGYNPAKDLTVKASMFPGLAWVSIIIQILAMILLIFEAGDGITVFALSMDIVMVPIAIFAIQKWRGKIRAHVVIGADEMMFDDKFPYKSGKTAKVRAYRYKHSAGTPIVWMTIIFTAILVVISGILLNIYPSGEWDLDIFGDPRMGDVWIYTIVYVILCAIITYLAWKLGKVEPADAVSEAAEKK
jgi:AAT family amino acid transporter